MIKSGLFNISTCVNLISYIYSILKDFTFYFLHIHPNSHKISRHTSILINILNIYFFNFEFQLTYQFISNSQIWQLHLHLLIGHFVPSFVPGGRGHVVGIAREGTKGLLLPPFGFQLRVPGSLYHAKMNYFTLLPSLSLALPTTATSPPPPPPPPTSPQYFWICYYRWQILLLDSPNHKTEGVYFQGLRATYMTVSRQNEREKK